MITKRATLRLISPDGDVYETESGFTFTQQIDGCRAQVGPIPIERDFVFEAIEVPIWDFHYTGNSNCPIVLNAGDTLTLEGTLTMADKREEADNDVG